VKWEKRKAWTLPSAAAQYQQESRRYEIAIAFSSECGRREEECALVNRRKSGVSSSCIRGSS